jgi:DNA-binding beta-propeller fold protein YncE
VKRSYLLGIGGVMLASLSQGAFAQGQALPTGQTITPLAVPGARFAPLVSNIGPFPTYVADGAAAIAVSPDGSEMLVLTSGFNRFNAPNGQISLGQSGQYIFVYAISAKGSTLKQSLTLPNSYSGIAWLPSGKGFVVGGGVDDVVHIYARGAKGFAEEGSAIKLGHKTGVGTGVTPQAAGVAVSPDGAQLLVANYYNDSVTLIDLAKRTIITEQDLRPGKIDPGQSGKPGGEFPLFVTWRDKGHAYVSSPRDREIVVLDVAAGKVSVTKRIATIGQPTALLYDAAKSRLYAAQDNADRLAIINTRTDTLVAQPRLGVPDVLAAGPIGKGVNPNSLTLTPAGKLLVTYGGINALALVEPRDAATEVVGLVPTGWYPSASATSRDGKQIFVVNRKSVPGPNPKGCAPKRAVSKAQPDACGGANQYIFQMEKAGLLQFPAPSQAALAKATLQVADNIGLTQSKARAEAEAKMAALRAKIKHVIYIVKENRTYDQVLGDLEIGNGDPSLAILGERFSPNHHTMARQFVTLDNFYDSGEQSSTGWTWTTAGRVADLLEKTAPVNYAQRGLAYEAEGSDRNIATGLTFEERRKVDPTMPNDPDVLPGPALLTSPDADDDAQPGQGHIWHAAIRAGLSVRNYGFSPASVYDPGNPATVPLVREPAKEKVTVFVSADPALANRSDPYFRSFDMKFPDYWLAKEWIREFDQQMATKSMPNLTLLRLSHDHFGSYEQAIDGIDTVETQMADNDYAVGMVLERLANSEVRDSTLVFIIEDDAQNGTDHVDARRSIAFVAGPYVKQKALVSTRYTTVSMLRTIESVLGLKPLGLNTALALPMADVFDMNQTSWSFKAKAADILRTTKLPIPAAAYVTATAAVNTCPVRDVAFWSAAMQGQDFSGEDKLDETAFNAALWKGLGTGAQPTIRSGADLRDNRAALLAAARKPGC